MPYSLILLAMLSVVSGAAMADERADGLKKMSTELCGKRAVSGGGKSGREQTPYCRCVSDAYWDSIPKAESDELYSGTAASIEKHQNARLAAAKESCKKKSGG